MSAFISLDDFSLHYPNMKIGRFSLKAGEKIPLHMHANQFGLAYLLQGKCLVKTYVVEEINNEQFSLILNADEELTANSYAVLTPKINAHEIYAIEDSTFLDIFSPGGAGRQSDYLEIIKSEPNQCKIIVRKIAIEQVSLPLSLINNLGTFTKIS